MIILCRYVILWSYCQSSLRMTTLYVHEHDHDHIQRRRLHDYQFEVVMNPSAEEGFGHLNQSAVRTRLLEWASR
jgi:hypothetical protein